MLSFRNRTGEAGDNADTGADEAARDGKNSRGNELTKKYDLKSHMDIVRGV